MDYENYKNNFLRKLQLPQDVFAGATLVSVVGRYEVTIENYKALITCNPDEIKLQGKKGYIVVTGEHLEIVYYTSMDMRILGCIHQIQYI